MESIQRVKKLWMEVVDQNTECGQVSGGEDQANADANDEYEQQAYIAYIV